MAMEIYFQTRGTARSAGYSFLGTEPERAWWSRYRKFTAFEYPTILVESTTGGWRIFLSGIPSSRIDATGTTNRCTIVIESVDHGDEDIEPVVQLVSTWLGDINNQRSEGNLQHALDEVFTDDVVTQLYTQEGEEAWREVTDNVQQALQKLKVSDEPAELANETPPAWIAPVRWPQGRAGFIDQVRKLLERDHGAAILVNRISNPDAFRDAPHPEGGLFVLATDDKLTEKFHPLPKKALTPSHPRAAQTNGTSRSITKRKILYSVVAVLVVVLIGMTVWLILIL